MNPALQDTLKEILGSRIVSVLLQSSTQNGWASGRFKSSTPNDPLEQFGDLRTLTLGKYSDAEDPRGGPSYEDGACGHAYQTEPRLPPGHTAGKRLPEHHQQRRER